MQEKNKIFEHSLKRLESLIQNVRSGIIVENDQREIVLVNQYLFEIIPVSNLSGEFIKMNSTEITISIASVFNYPEKFIERIAEILEHKMPVFAEQIELANGRILERDFIPINFNSEFIGYLWSYRDISELVQTRTELEKQKLFYEEILGNLPEDVAVWDKNHVYKYCNATAITDPDLRKWIIDKDDFEYCKLKNKDAKIADERRANFKKTIEGQQTIEFIEEFELPDGSSEFKMRRMKPVFNPDGDLSFVIGYGLNITDMIKTERALLESKKLAEASLIAKERFLANVSHELRTPLNGIKGIVNLLSVSELNTEQKNWVKLLESAAGNLTGLVDDLLDVALINRGEIELKQESFNLYNCLNEISGIFSVQANAKKLTWVEKHTVPDNLYIHADKLRISQILNNILSNALKFTDNGKIIFSSEINFDSDSEVIAEFRIEDTGSGIHPEYQDKIFEAFTRVHPLSQKYSGTGLGLNITQKIVELYQGTIHLESIPDKGSVFIIRIPFALSSGQEKINNTAIISAAEKFNILVVEDHPVNRFLLNTQLQQSGYTVDNAESGAEAIKIIHQKNIDLILLDFQLPDMTGTELFQEIRKTEAFKNIPVIAITANACPLSKMQALNLGLDDYLSKPYKVFDLMEKIAGLLNTKISDTNSISK